MVVRFFRDSGLDLCVGFRIGAGNSGLHTLLFVSLLVLLTGCYRVSGKAKDDADNEKDTGSAPPTQCDGCDENATCDVT